MIVGLKIQQWSLVLGLLTSYWQWCCLPHQLKGKRRSGRSPWDQQPPFLSLSYLLHTDRVMGLDIWVFVIIFGRGSRRVQKGWKLEREEWTVRGEKAWAPQVVLEGRSGLSWRQAEAVKQNTKNAQRC